MGEKRKRLKEIFQEVKQREKLSRRKQKEAQTINNGLDVTGSECDLVIDDDYEEHTLSASALKKKQIGISLQNEPTDLTCLWDNCNERFDSQQNFNKHVDEHANNLEEDNGLFACQFGDCTQASLSLEMLIRHLSFHSYHERLKNIGNNVVERVNLPKCTQSNIFEIPVLYKDYACEWEDCNRVFRTLHAFILHIKIHINSNPKYCKKGETIECGWTGCLSKFSSQYKLTDHVRSHTKERMLACPTCGNMFASKTKFIDHRKRQTPYEMHSLQCTECSKLFPSERLLRDHMRMHVNIYKCPMCDMTCPKPSSLAMHIRFRHVNERPFKCNFCEHSCVSKTNLESHLMTHCAENLMACEECDFTCRSWYGLEKHIQTEHGNGATPNYACHICDKKFLRGNYVTKHIIRKHGFKWPSGHSRFKYREDADGYFKLQLNRFECIDESPKVKEQSFDEDVKYDIKKCPKDKHAYVVTVSNVEPTIVTSTNKDIIITIDDVDMTGNIIKSQVVESKEIIATQSMINI